MFNLTRDCDLGAYSFARTNDEKKENVAYEIIERLPASLTSPNKFLNQNPNVIEIRLLCMTLFVFRVMQGVMEMKDLVDSKDKR